MFLSGISADRRWRNSRDSAAATWLVLGAMAFSCSRAIAHPTRSRKLRSQTHCSPAYERARQERFWPSLARVQSPLAETAPGYMYTDAQWPTRAHVDQRRAIHSCFHAANGLAPRWRLRSQCRATRGHHRVSLNAGVTPAPGAGTRRRRFAATLAPGHSGRAESRPSDTQNLGTEQDYSASAS